MRPSAKSPLLCDPDPTPPPAIHRPGLLGVEMVRTVLERLSKAGDDPASAMSLLLVVRTFALERGEGLVIELSGLDIGMLVTLDDTANGLWIAEMLPLSLGTVKGVLATIPELLLPFERAETEDAISLRIPSTSFGIPGRMTPVALPSIGLLVEAGLLARRGS